MSEFLGKYDKIPLEFSRDHGLTSVGVVIGKGPNALEVAITRSRGHPAATQMRNAWQDRLRGRPNPLLLVTLYDDKAAICGPTGDNPPVHWDLDIQSVDRICHAALEEPNRHAAHRFIQTVMSGLDEELLGIRNEGLLATHYLRVRMPERADWREGVEKASPLLERRDRDLLAGLGYEIEPLDRAHVLVATGTRVAVAVFLHAGEAFDQQQERFVRKSPVAYALVQAEKHNLRYVVASAGGRLRLYLTDPSAAVAPRGATETFVEIHLDVLRSGDAGYLWLLFSGDALARGGTLEEALRGSRDYSAELGRRLRERIDENVLPNIAKVIAAKMGVDRPSKEDLDMAYGTALALLFRLLFVAYAEDRDLLPYRRNQRYEAHSLKQKAKEILSVTKEGEAFDSASTSHWSDVFVLFHAISRGNKEWDVPEYNGDLFSSDPEVSPEGALLEEIELTNDVFGLVLSKLLLDWTEDRVRGPVDFRSLGVREFGVIYEGLLESGLSVAGQPLKVGANGLYVPLEEGEEAVVQVGEFYMHNASGQRKSTGTYFTKDFLVEHLLNHSLEPALEAHLQRLDEMSDRDAEAVFFDFRIADIAMGSAHFLVAAVDHTERRLSAYLTERELRGVEEELDGLQAKALRATEGEELQVFIDDRALLRRQIARRCIYGVDLNPLAVQLARLSLWTHTFVPGLPLSFLDHNLVCGNSLVGVATVEEAAKVLDLTRDKLLSYIAGEKVEVMWKVLQRLGRLADSDAREIREARTAQRELDELSAPQQAIFDVVTARWVDETIDVGMVLASSRPLEDLPGSQIHKKAAIQIAPLRPLHFPTAFPEVFRSERRGFDVIIGNPPWEEATLEEDDFWTRYIPGLQGLPQYEQERVKADHRRQHPDLVKKYEEEVERQEIVRRFLVRGPFRGMGTGDPDVYKAFCWRFWDLVREDGHVGVVLPRSAFSAKGSEIFRKHLLEHATFTDVTMLLNNRQWVFEMVHPQYTMALASFRRRKPDGNATLPLRGPYRSLEEFQKGVRGEPARFPQSEVSTWTDSAALPLLPTADSVAVFRKLREAPNLLNPNETGWRALPVTELHATNDKKKKDGTVLMHLVKEPPRGSWPIYKGTSFDLWRPDTGVSYAWGDPEVMLTFLQGRRERGARNSRSAFSKMDIDWTNDKQTLPCLHPRIVFRDVTNRTNRRTVIAALIPPHVFITNTAPHFIWPVGVEKDQAYLLGIMCSIPLDWYSRRFVEIHVNFHILNGFPIPRPPRDSDLWRRTVQLAGRLAAVDDRFASWAKAVGVEWGLLPEDVKQDMIHELDAVVAHLYGLSEDDTQHIFATFHQGWDYSERLKGVLGYYREWEGVQ